MRRCGPHRLAEAALVALLSTLPAAGEQLVAVDYRSFRQELPSHHGDFPSLEHWFEEAKGDLRYILVPVSWLGWSQSTDEICLLDAGSTMGFVGVFSDGLTATNGLVRGTALDSGELRRVTADHPDALYRASLDSRLLSKADVQRLQRVLWMNALERSESGSLPEVVSPPFIFEDKGFLNWMFTTLPGSHQLLLTGLSEGSMTTLYGVPCEQEVLTRGRSLSAKEKATVLALLDLLDRDVIPVTLRLTVEALSQLSAEDGMLDDLSHWLRAEAVLEIDKATRTLFPVSFERIELTDMDDGQGFEILLVGELAREALQAKTLQTTLNTSGLLFIDESTDRLSKRWKIDLSDWTNPTPLTARLLLSNGVNFASGSLRQHELPLDDFALREPMEEIRARLARDRPSDNELHSPPSVDDLFSDPRAFVEDLDDSQFAQFFFPGVTRAEAIANLTEINLRLAAIWACFRHVDLRTTSGDRRVDLIQGPANGRRDRRRTVAAESYVEDYFDDRFKQTGHRSEWSLRISPEGAGQGVLEISLSLF